jgi:hypothetical protein
VHWDRDIDTAYSRVSNPLGYSDHVLHRDDRDYADRLVRGDWYGLFEIEFRMYPFVA